MTDFSAFYKRYAPEVFRFALYLSGEASEAEDITSETFVRVWASPTRLEMRTVKSYLFTIARNLFLQGLRKRSRHVRLLPELPDSKPGLQAQMEQQAELRAVLERLQKLPEIDRAALLLRTLDELPYEEIARVLGISVTLAKVKVHRARVRLEEVRAGQNSHE
jgi:RNA polymerase sigma-70 factor (ECF subfamily)